MITFVLPMLLGKIPAAARYMFPLIFPVLILLGEGVQQLLYRGRNYNKYLRLIITVLVFIIIFLNFSKTTNDIISKNEKKLDSINDLSSFQKYVNCENIYFRSHLVAPFFQNNRVYSITDLELEDAIILIGWESDQKINEVMDKYQIRYLLLYKSEYWERDFHSWITIANGGVPRHYIEIENSTYFTKIHQSKNFKLYEFTF